MHLIIVYSINNKTSHFTDAWQKKGRKILVDQQKKRIVLDIGGMHCATCVQTIEKRLPKLKGVIYATINLAAEKAIIDYDPAVVNQQAIEDAITEIGYKVIHQNVTLKLSGMHCTMCAQGH